MQAPSTPPKRTRVVICLGPYCNGDRRAARFYKRLKERVEQINGDQYPPPIKLETANCMSMCGIGPNMMLYPQAMLFNDLTDEALERMIDQYLDKFKSPE